MATIFAPSERMWLLKKLSCLVFEENNLPHLVAPVDQDQTLAHPETNSGSLIKACAMPTRWSIPLEYWRS